MKNPNLPANPEAQINAPVFYRANRRTMPNLF